MIEVNYEKLKELANDLLFDMNEDEYKTLLKEFDVLLKQVDLLGKIANVDEQEVMIYPFDVTNDYLREDQPLTPLDKTEALSNAPSQYGGQVRLPKVVG